MCVIPDQNASGQWMHWSWQSVWFPLVEVVDDPKGVTSKIFPRYPNPCVKKIEFFVT
jgi:hypothetical protein